MWRWLNATGGLLGLPEPVGFGIESKVLLTVLLTFFPLLVASISGFQILDEHVKHCVAGALTSGDEADAQAKTTELLDAVHRFAKTR